MMNRPRPRKIVSVIKTSPSAESIEEKPFEQNLNSQKISIERKVSIDTVSNDFKPQSPVVPSFSSSGPARPSTDTKLSTISQQNQSNSFVSRKPVVATLKKAHVPPPPSFSDSPKSSPVSITKSEKIELEKSLKSAQTSNEQLNPLSPRSSGEAFLDAADKAADFIGGALLNSFKNFNLTDETSIKMTSQKESAGKDEDDPFADIMKKLKSQQAQKLPVNQPVINVPFDKKSEFINLMDEEPPETFKQFNEPSGDLHKSSIKPEPSSFIKAAFSSKPKESVKIFGNEIEESEATRAENVDNIENDSLKFNNDSEDEAARCSNTLTGHINNISEKVIDIPKQDYSIVNESMINIVNEVENYTEIDEPIIEDELKDKDLLIVEDIEDHKVESKSYGNAVDENLVYESIVNDHNEPKFVDEVSVEPIFGKGIVYEIVLKEESKSIKSTSHSMSMSQSPPSAFAFPTFEERTVYESKPIINFDGSVSSGPAYSNEQVSSSSTIPFFDSLSSIISSSSSSSSSSSNSDSSSVSSPTNSSIKSPTSPNSKTTGFRASILKHGLSALEKIGKSTADVVVSTRNKLSEPSAPQFASSQQIITPDFNDEKASFYDILKLYGGYSKLQELQLKGVKASISMKLSRKNEKNSERISSFDYQSRMKIRREISGILHPDKIMNLIDDAERSNFLFLVENEFIKKFRYFSKFEDEIFCIQKLLKSLENILIISNDEEVLISSNRRRHIICQISTVFSSLLQKLIQTQTTNSSIEIAKEISIFTSQIIKYLQTNFARNCEDFSRVDHDQQLAIKLFLDISYSTVPQLQLFY